jgi:hypothetical protein
MPEPLKEEPKEENTVVKLGLLDNLLMGVIPEPIKEEPKKESSVAKPGLLDDLLMGIMPEPMNEVTKTDAAQEILQKEKKKQNMKGVNKEEEEEGQNSEMTMMLTRLQIADGVDNSANQKLETSSAEPRNIKEDRMKVLEVKIKNLKSKKEVLDTDIYTMMMGDLMKEYSELL